MTRRLALAMFAFTFVVLLVSVVPLGVSISSRDRQDYTTGTEQLARSLGTLSEEAFEKSGTALSPARLRTAAGNDAGVVVTDLSGKRLVATGPSVAAPAALVTGAASGRVVSSIHDDQVVVAAPVTPDGKIRGVVLVVRPDDPVEHRITRMWLLLGVIALFAFALSMGLAFLSARWVVRPLTTLKETASRWAEGRLGQRAEAAVGPPEVREVAHALNTMAGRLDALVEGSQRMLADVSHQLRTPLSAMRLRLELLRADSEGDSEDDLTAALAEVERLSRLVDGLLAVARAEHVDASPEAVDVARLAEERRVAWQPVADERSTTVAVESAAHRTVASVTPGHLEQVLDNILANALGAVDTGGKVVMRVQGRGDQVVLEVSDNGPGMTRVQCDEAFHRFTSARQKAGSGLGLAIVHRLVTADGGTVRLESAPGQGTTVVIELPAVRSGRFTASRETSA